MDFRHVATLKREALVCDPPEKVPLVVKVVVLGPFQWIKQMYPGPTQGQLINEFIHYRKNILTCDWCIIMYVQHRQD